MRDKDPVGWRRCRIGGLAEFVNGRAFRLDEWAAVGLPIVRIQNLTSPESDFNRFQGKLDPGHRIDTGDVLVAWSASLDAYTWHRGPAALNQHIFKVDPHDGIVDRRYLFHLLQHAMTEIRRQVHGTTMRHITKRAFESTVVSVPPRLEQQAVAAVLDSIDDAIEGTEAVIAATERMRKALLHDLLTHGVPGWHSEWKHVPGIGTMPADWEVAAVEDLYDVLDSKRVPLNADERAQIPGSYPYYGANGIVDFIDRWIFDDELVLLAEDGGHFDQFRERPIAYRVQGKCWVNNHAHVLRPAGHLDSSFLFHSLVHKDIRPFINGSTRSKLTQSDLRNIGVAHPRSAGEAKIIGSGLDSVDGLLTGLHTQNACLQALKPSTADALLTGRVRVPSPIVAT